jgi:hypothetical protein
LPAVAAGAFLGVANGLDTVPPDDHPPKAEEEVTVLLKEDKALPVEAFEDDATGWEANAEELFTALKGEAVEEKAPNVAWGFLAGLGVEGDSGFDGVEERLLASRTLALISDDSEDPMEPPDRADVVGLADAKGDAAEENEPKVAWGFFTGVETVGGGTVGSTTGSLTGSVVDSSISTVEAVWGGSFQDETYN